MSHSTGPWSAQKSDNNDYEWEITRNERYIAVICDEPGYGGTAEENAHLIAAAPELLEALEDLLGLVPEMHGTTRKAEEHNAKVERAKNAIAHAKGADK